MVQSLLNRLPARGFHPIYAAENRVGNGLSISWTFEDEPTSASDSMTVDGVEVRLDSVDAVANRSMGTVPPVGLEPADRTYMVAEWLALVNGLTNRLTCPVVNRLRPTLWFAPILGPMDLPLHIGTSFQVAETHVIAAGPGDPWGDDLGDGASSGLVYQPVSQLSTYGLEGEEQREALRTVAGLLPVSIRSRQARAAVQVLVIGDSVFVPDGGARRASADLSDLEERAIRAARGLGLAVCELRVSRCEGEWRCELASALPMLESYPAALRPRIVDELIGCLDPP